MVGAYVYTPYIWPSFLTIILLVALFFYAWRRRSMPGALPFAVGSLFAVLWTVGAVLEMAAVDAATQIFWIKFQAAWQLPAVSAITCFVVEYTWPGRWLTRRNLILISVPPLLFGALVLTNDFHHLAWRGFLLADSVIPQRGAGLLLFVAYGYGLGLLELLVFAWLFVRSPQHRWPVVVMVSGLVGGRALYLADLGGIAQMQLPLDVLLLAYLFLMYSIALFGFHILDPIPLARQTAIEQMGEGMVVLDNEERVVSLNPAAEAIFGTQAKRALGEPVRKLLPAYAALGKDLVTAEGGRAETCIERGGEARYYVLVLSPLKDWRGSEIGRLLLLHDVTGQKQAQAQLVEQQRALAMMQEREQLARELHDSLGQALAFIHTQGQTVRRLLSRGDVATADAYTGRLVEVAREADVDIRESILGLRVPLSEEGFFPTLERYLVAYEKRYGIHAELEAPEAGANVAFEPLVEVQLLRIVQEALANVRKHANAGDVRIAFTLEDGRARVAIRDNGDGFDPAGYGGRADAHIGLEVMRERAEAVGGSFRLRSRPGRGTEVVVRVPVKGKGEGARERQGEREEVRYG